ncbi:hypothetical protein [Prauserella muralis]|uniref:hypothetical protein n=1 Tax=Prauserella muralis TaxID=588067 RepID=UPI001472A359|nr:hypothetical protein [Prauserella muralis]
MAFVALNATNAALVAFNATNATLGKRKRSGADPKAATFVTFPLLDLLVSE